MKVTILYNTEHGWDCIQGVFKSEIDAVKYLNEKYYYDEQPRTKSEFEEICWVFTNKEIT